MDGIVGQGMFVVLYLQNALLIIINKYMYKGSNRYSPNPCVIGMRANYRHSLIYGSPLLSSTTHNHSTTSFIPSIIKLLASDAIVEGQLKITHQLWILFLYI